MGRPTKAAAAEAAKTKNTKTSQGGSGASTSRKAATTRSARSDDDAPRGLGEVESEALEPIEVVRRELTRPDGSVVVVEVPVYPPFRLSENPGPRKAPPRNRSAPSLKGKRRQKTGSGKS